MLNEVYIREIDNKFEALDELSEYRLYELGNEVSSEEPERFNYFRQFKALSPEAKLAIEATPFYQKLKAEIGIVNIPNEVA